MLDGSPSADAGDEMSGVHEFDYPSPIEDDDSMNRSPHDLAFGRTAHSGMLSYPDSAGFPSSQHHHYRPQPSSYPSYSSSSDLHSHVQLSHSGGNRVIQLPSVHDRSGSEGSISGSASQHSSSGDLNNHAGSSHSYSTHSSQIPPSHLFASASEQLGVHAYQWPIPSAPRGANPSRGANAAWPPSMITPLNTGGAGGGRNERSLPALSPSKHDVYTPPPLHSSRPWSSSNTSQPSPTASSTSSHLSSHSSAVHYTQSLPTLSAPFFPDGRGGPPSPGQYQSSASSNSASPEAYFSTAAQLPLATGSAYGRAGGGSEYDTPSYGVHHSHQPSSYGAHPQHQRVHSQDHHHSQLLPASMLPSRNPHMIPVSGECLVSTGCCRVVHRVLTCEGRYSYV